MNLTNSIQIEDFNGKTALVTINKEERRLPAKLIDYGILEGSIEVRGLVGAYASGGKLWDATATLIEPKGHPAWISVEFGFNSRSGKHTKRGAVAFKNNAA